MGCRKVREGGMLAGNGVYAIMLSNRDGCVFLYI